MSSPTQRSLALLRKTWPLVQVTEKWNPFAKVRQDLFGFIDVLCCGGDSVLAVQTTSGANVSARYEKLRYLPAVVHWLQSSSRQLVIHGWARRGERGKRKLCYPNERGSRNLAEQLTYEIRNIRNASQH